MQRALWLACSRAPRKECHGEGKDDEELERNRRVEGLEPELKGIERPEQQRPESDSRRSPPTEDDEWMAMNPRPR